MLANPNFHFPGRQNMIASTNSAPTSPTPLSTSSDVKSKRRSSTHSRQLSLSNASSQSSPTSPARPTSGSRPVSGHHRRQSSVSSRRESREIMGLASPTDASEESFSGDSRQHALWALEGKKSVPGLTIGFSKVEIPDWQTPDGEKEEFTWPTAASGSSAKRTLTPGSTTPLAYTPSSSLANKRDSFGKSLLSASSSLKEQLHTLMEEDEDAEEEEERKLSPAIASELDQAPAAESTTAFVEEPESITEDSNDADVISKERVLEEVAISTSEVPNAPFDLDATPLASSTTKLPSAGSLTETSASPSTSPRPRPPTLLLRPLSLVSSLPITSQTSAATTNTIPHSIRYKSLTLATNLPTTQTTTTSRNTNEPPRRHSLLMNGAQLAPSSSQLATRSVNRQRRRGSLGYRRSGEDHNPTVSQSTIASLRRQSLPMTPGLTPNSTVSGRSTSPSTPSDSISSSRASSEFFQSQAVSSLLSRIASLEEALALSTAATSPSSDARMSFPIMERLASLEEEDDGVAKKVHIPPPGRQPTDDLIDIIADLKTERDELNNDIVGWRTRCADLTHSTEALQRRLADERRELLLLHQRLSTVTADLNDSRSAKLKLEDELVSERAAGAASIRERQGLEEELNDERMERIGLEMKTEKERLAWQKERSAWETERKGWIEERTQLEETLRRCEDTITSLRAELDDRTRQLERLQGTSADAMPTSKLKQPWTGGKFAFPAVSSPPRSESPEQPRPRTSIGFGGLNTGFKFGGGSSTPSSGNSTPRPLSSSPPADAPTPANPLRPVAEEEEDEGQYASYQEDGDSDDDLSEAGPNSSRSSAVNLNSPLASPVSAVPVPVVHQHRRSVSRVANWRFPSPRALDQRRQVATNTSLKEKKDRFFACLEDDEDDQGHVAPPRLLGKPLKEKEHKKLPSGCPAFWLDCDDEDQVLKWEAPLPSPATTEEEDDTETDSIVSRSPVSTTLSFPLIPRTIVTPASASPSRSSSPVDAPVTIQVFPPVTVSVVPPANVPTPPPPPLSRPTVVRPTVPSTPPAPTAPRVAAPVFIPATNPTTPLPAPAFSTAPLTTVPPAPIASMTIPPSINVVNNAVSSAPSPPSKVAATSSGYFGRLPTLSSMISWGTPRGRSSDSEDAFIAYPATSSSAAAPSASSSPAQILKAKHVDPEVMRERLRLQLEREGRLPPTKPRTASGKVVMNHGAFSMPNSIESCGSCNSRNVLEL